MSRTSHADSSRLLCKCHLHCVVHVWSLTAAVIGNRVGQCFHADVLNRCLHVIIHIVVDVLVEEPCRCLFCLKIDGFLFKCGPRSAPVPPGKPFMKSFSDDVVRSGFPIPL